jgi:hypothetical protein
MNRHTIKHVRNLYVFDSECGKIIKIGVSSNPFDRLIKLHSACDGAFRFKVYKIVEFSSYDE